MQDISGGQSRTRRIIVRDSNPAAPPRTVHGRRLQDPPKMEVAISSPRHRGQSHWKLPTIRRSCLIGGFALLMMGALFAGVSIGLREFASRRSLRTTAPGTIEEPLSNSQIVPATQSNELHQIESDAKEVVRRISRDSRPYSFSEGALEDIQTRVRDHSQSSHLSHSLLELQENAEAINVKAEKEGLSPNLVALVALSLTKGGENGDPVSTVARVLPSLALLNKMFGSNEADACLILIAAFREGAGTKRSHPLLRRMNKAVSNPLTERNIWYLHDRNVVTDDAYYLVVDTIAYGILARNPRQFGLDNDPLNL